MSNRELRSTPNIHTVDPKDLDDKLVEAVAGQLLVVDHKGQPRAGRDVGKLLPVHDLLPLGVEVVKLDLVQADGVVDVGEVPVDGDGQVRLGCRGGCGGGEGVNVAGPSSVVVVYNRQTDGYIVYSPFIALMQCLSLLIFYTFDTLCWYAFCNRF